MANTLVTPTQVTYEVAMYFVNSLRGVAQFDRQYSDEFAREGAKVGDTVKIRLPQQWEANEGDAFVEQNILDRTVNLIINRRRHVGFGYTSAQATLDLEEIRDRYVQPAAETLASVFDRLAMADVYKSVYNAVGTPGTTPSAGLTYSQARVKILDLAGPDEGLVAVLDPLASATLADSTKTYFNPQDKLGKNWTRGMFQPEQLGIAKWLADQNVPRFTTGATTTATPLINGAGQTGSSIVTDGWGSGTTSLKKGDIFTFAGVHFVNPLSKESTGRLAQFTLTADVSDTTGAVTMSISPSIVTSGPLQNVTGAPADNAVITYWSMSAGGTQSATVSPQNLVFHPQAFATAVVDLFMPAAGTGVKGARVSSKQLNVSLRYLEQFSVTDDKNRNRLDLLWGTAPVQERLACRVVG
jgi:hypothetical protein